MPNPFRPIRPGEPIGTDHPFFSATRNNALTALVDPSRQGAVPSPGPELGGGGTTATIRSGVVQSGTAAANAQSSCEKLTEGSVVVREWVAIPLWDAGESYAEGNIVRLVAAAHDEATTYDTGDLAEVSGEVMQRTGASTSGPYNATGWTKVADQGDAFCADEAVPAGDWDGTKWSASDATITLDRETTTLDHRFPFVPEAGTLALWTGSTVHELQPPGGGGSVDRPGIELDSRGTLAVRLVSADYTSEWSRVPVHFCSPSGPVSSPGSEPT